LRAQSSTKTLFSLPIILSSHPPFDIYMSGLLARPGIGQQLLAADPSLAVRYGSS
jgi:hypothetical protein